MPDLDLDDAAFMFIAFMVPIFLIAVAPLAAFWYVARVRNRELFWVRTPILALVTGIFFTVALIVFFDWAKYQLLRIDLHSFCQGNHWVCACIDAVLKYSSWFSYAGAGLLSFFTLLTVLLLRPNLLSWDARA